MYLSDYLIFPGCLFRTSAFIVNSPGWPATTDPYGVEKEYHVGDLRGGAYHFPCSLHKLHHCWYLAVVFNSPALSDALSCVYFASRTLTVRV